MKLDVVFKKKETPIFTHPEFSEVEVWIGTYGDNTNGSNISKDAYENALPSLDNIPIVGVFDEKIEDFKGHGSKIIIEDGKIETVKVTKPYGVVPSPSNARWQKDDKGVEYLVCDGILWTGRYKEAEKVWDNESNQSMEIHVNKSTVDSRKILMIEDFYWSSLCVLGSDTAPCFDSAKIVYSLDKDGFTQEFSLLINEIEKIKESVKGGNSKVNKEEILAKFVHLKGEEFEAIVNNEELSLEDLEEQLFALSTIDLQNRIQEVLASHTYEHTYSWGETETYRKYRVEDIIPSENLIVVRDNETRDKCLHLGVNYSFSNDSVTLDLENSKRYIRGDWREFSEGDMEESIDPMFEVIETKCNAKIEDIKSSFKVEETEEYSKIVNDYKELEKNFNELQSEKDELTKFQISTLAAQKEAEIEELFSRFDELSDVEGFSELKEKSVEMDLGIVETQLFAMLGKKNFSKKETSKKPSSTTVKVPVINKSEENVTESEMRYGIDFKQYIKR